MNTSTFVIFCVLGALSAASLFTHIMAILTRRHAH